MEIYVLLNKLDEAADECRNLANRLNQIDSRFNSLSRSIDCKIRSKSAITKYINTLSSQINNAEHTLQKHSSFFLNAKSTYLNAENSERYESEGLKNQLYKGRGNTKNNFVNFESDKVIDKIKNLKFNFIKDLISRIDVENASSSEKDNLLLKILLETAKGAGYFGAILSFGSGIYNGILGIVGGENTYKLTAKNIKTGSKAIKSLLKFSKDYKNIGLIERAVGKGNTKAMWLDRFLGLNDTLKSKASKATAFGNRFKRNFGQSVKNSFKDLGFKNGKAAGALSWLAIVCDGVINYFNNQEEMKTDGISKSRAWAETISETVIDFGKGVAIGAAVTAGLGAAIGSAPVVAVAAGTAAISVGLDYVTKKFTNGEKGFTEFVSDGVLDLGKKGLDAVSDLGKAAKTDLQNGFNKITGCFKNTTGKLGSKWKISFGF